jgi:hypothetical protein
MIDGDFSAGGFGSFAGEASPARAGAVIVAASASGVVPVSREPYRKLLCRNFSVVVWLSEDSTRDLSARSAKQISAKGSKTRLTPTIGLTYHSVSGGLNRFHIPNSPCARKAPGAARGIWVEGKRSRLAFCKSRDSCGCRFRISPIPPQTSF